MCLTLTNTGNLADNGKDWLHLQLDMCAMAEPGSACRQSSRGPVIVPSAGHYCMSWQSAFWGVRRRAAESKAKFTTMSCVV